MFDVLRTPGYPVQYVQKNLRKKCAVCRDRDVLLTIGNGCSTHEGIPPSNLKS